MMTGVPVPSSTPVRHFLRCCGVLLSVTGLWGEEPDLGALPPPHSGRVDFVKDIQPILEAHCLRCHGPERPKSGFRLDNRQSALEGGAWGVAILEGHSAESPMIHYVARLVPEMEMPPTGKGDPLKPYEISLLRAWIDQGLDYAGADAPEVVRLKLDLTAGAGYIDVDGDAARFRRISRLNDGWYGGVTRFEAEGPIDERTQFSMDGRVIGGQDNARLRFEIRRDDWGRLRAGLSSRREWFDDSGGYYPAFTPALFELNRDLYLDHGRAWVDWFVERENWPLLRFGYEYQFREGDRSTLSWGPVSDPVRNIYPGVQRLDETAHRFKFDVSKEVNDWYLENSLRVEWYDQQNTRQNVTAFNQNKPGPEKYTVVDQGYDHVQLANAITVQKWIREWLMIGGGYLYSSLDGEASFVQSSFLTDNALLPPVVGFVGDWFWNSTRIVLDQRSHVGSLSTRIGPWNEFLVYGGVQGDWMQQRGFSDVTQRFGSPAGFAVPVGSGSDIDRQLFEERVGARFTGLPFSSLFVEGLWQQEDVGQFENQTTPFPPDYVRRTEAEARLEDYRFGFNTSPWRPILLTAQYRIAYKKNRYEPGIGDLSNGLAGNGYPNFISGRDTDRRDVEVGLVTRIASNLKVHWKYIHDVMDYRTMTRALLNPPTPAGALNSGEQEADLFSLGLSWNPIPRLGFQVAGSYADSRLETFDNESPSVVPYDGDLWSLTTTAIWTLDAKTRLDLGHVWSHSDYRQSQFSDGLPLGMRYQWHQLRAGVRRQIHSSLSLQLQYLWQRYEEPSVGTFNDFTANGFFVGLNWTWESAGSDAATAGE